MRKTIRFKFGGGASGYAFRITYTVERLRHDYYSTHIISITSHDMNINPNIFIQVLSKTDVKETVEKYPRWGLYTHISLNDQMEGFEDITNLFGFHEKVTIYYGRI